MNTHTKDRQKTEVEGGEEWGEVVEEEDEE